MRLEQLNYLMEIAKTHSISMAAENLYVSQSTVSESIKKLEDELQVTLFTRSKSGVFLTSIGTEIMHLAQEITQLTQQIRQKALSANAAGQMESILQGTLMLNVPLGFGQMYANDMLPLFLRQYPNISLSMVEASLSQTLEHIREGSRNLGLLYASKIDVLKQYPDLITQCFKVESLYILVNQTSPLAKKNDTTLAEISKYPLIILCFESDFVAGIDYICDPFLEKNLSYDVALQTSSLQLFLNCITHDQVGYMLPQSLLNILLPHSGLVPLKIADKMKANLYAIYRQDSPKRPLIEAFLRVFQEFLVDS